MGDDYLESFIEQKTEVLDSICSSVNEEGNEFFKEYEKLAKLYTRATKTNNYNSMIKLVETSRYKEIFGIEENVSNIVEKETCIVNVKKEKSSLTSNSSVQSVGNDENMPAPKMPPPKKKRVKKEKVSSVTKVKKQPVSDDTEKRVTRSTVDRMSDVILQDPEIPVIELDDSSEKIEEPPIRSTRTRTIRKEEPAPIRSTRTRTKKALEENGGENETIRSTRTRTKAKRERSESDTEKKIVETKRSKSNSSAVKETQDNVSTHTEYEDALSQIDNKTNATFICSEKGPAEDMNAELPKIMNTTVVIEKSKPAEVRPDNHNDLLTDDESADEPEHNSEKLKKQDPNQVFSPYENSPVKKKVEAFEKFQKNETTTSSKKNTSRILKEIESNKGNVKEKAKGFGDSTLLKSNPPSASKIGKYIGSNSSIRKVTTPKSGLDFKERELKRLEKERELKKKEMLKQALTEERKKKYEEKILKVQQHQKEALEKEKEKALELQRIKEERYKMVQQQKEEKQRLLKEENEKRRLLAKQRAEEKKREEEALKMAEKKEYNRKLESDKNISKSTPIYMTQPTPPLPCDDCYDSDDERYTRTKQIPSWSSKPRHQRQDHLQTTLGHKIKNTLFCCKSQDIDLRAVFQNIDPRKLKRTSSAYWEKPPRFTILPSAFD